MTFTIPRRCVRRRWNGCLEDKETAVLKKDRREYKDGEMQLIYFNS